MKAFQIVDNEEETGFDKTSVDRRKKCVFYLLGYIFDVAKDPLIAKYTILKPVKFWGVIFDHIWDIGENFDAAEHLQTTI